MNITASSTDRALILTFVQEAVDRIALEAEVVHDPTASVALTQGTALYELGTSPFNISGIIAINEITVTDASLTNTPVTQVTMQEMLEMRQGAGQAQGSPYYYAVDYPDILFYPTPGASTTLNVTHIKDGPTIADSSTAISFLPKAFHFGAICFLATANAFRHKKMYSDASEYENRYFNDKAAGLPAIRRWRSRVGGRQRPQSRQVGVVVSSPSQDLGW